MEKTWTDAYAKLWVCMTRGIHITLNLRGGETVSRYRSHDVVAATGFEFRINASKAVLRGMVWPDRGRGTDRLINFWDIETVREERVPFRYSGDDGFYRRNRIPEGWVRVGTCPTR